MRVKHYGSWETNGPMAIAAQIWQFAGEKLAVRERGEERGYG